MINKYKRRDLFINDNIIKRIAKYDKKAFEILYNKTSGAVFGLAMSMLKNKSDAEDVVQETYISIYQNASKYKSKNKAMAWIFTITRNFALMKIRDLKKREHVNLDDLYNVGVENKIEEELYKEKIVDVLLSTLKEDERQIVVMHAMSNLKHKEIAKIMDISLSTELSKYKRSLQKLKKEMEVNEYEKS